MASVLASRGTCLDSQLQLSAISTLPLPSDPVFPEALNNVAPVPAPGDVLLGRPFSGDSRDTDSDGLLKFFSIPQ